MVCSAEKTDSAGVGGKRRKLWWRDHPRFRKGRVESKRDEQPARTEALMRITESSSCQLRE